MILAYSLLIGSLIFSFGLFIYDMYLFTTIFVIPYFKEKKEYWKRRIYYGDK